MCAVQKKVIFWSEFVSDSQAELFGPRYSCPAFCLSGFIIQLYMKTLENSRNDDAECVMAVGWAI